MCNKSFGKFFCTIFFLIKIKQSTYYCMWRTFKFSSSVLQYILVYKSPYKLELQKGKEDLPSMSISKTRPFRVLNYPKLQTLKNNKRWLSRNHLKFRKRQIVPNTLADQLLERIPRFFQNVCYIQ